MVAAGANVIFGHSLEGCATEKSEGITKYEKSFDNRWTAMVSREPRATSRGKSFALKTLESTDCC